MATFLFIGKHRLAYPMAARMPNTNLLGGTMRIRLFLIDVVLGRLLLTDLLEMPARTRKWFFSLEKLDLHPGIHEYCPGWCPCDVELDDEAEAA